jgi:hypothetical protein
LGLAGGGGGGSFVPVLEGILLREAPFFFSKIKAKSGTRDYAVMCPLPSRSINSIIAKKNHEGFLEYRFVVKKLPQDLSAQE